MNMWMYTCAEIGRGSLCEKLIRIYYLYLYTNYCITLFFGKLI